MRNGVLVWCLLGALGIFAQGKRTDSVLNCLQHTQVDSVRFKLYFSLVSGNTGSDKEALFLDSCLAIADRIPSYLFRAKAINQKGTFFFNKGENKKALLNYFKALAIVKEAGNQNFMSKCVNNIANCYDVMGIYDKALQYYFQSLKLKETLQLKNKIYISKLNIATVYYNLKEYKKAIAYSEEALTDCIKYQDELREGIIYHNLANNYSDLGDTPKAIAYFEKAIKIAVKTEDNTEYANSSLGLAHCYFEMKNFDKVLWYTQQALDTAKKYQLNIHVSSAENEFGEVYLMQKKYALAEKYLLAGLQDAKACQSTLNIKDAYLLLSKLYQDQKKMDQALHYYQLFSEVKDSLINDNKSQLLANLQENYEIEKKEAENKLLQTENELSGNTIKQQKRLNYLIVTGLALSLLFAFYIFKSLKKQRQANTIISRQKEEVHHQKEIVEEKQKEILDSIHYAKRIQRAVITSDDYLNQNLSDYFVFYQPKDIVSGDFYWALQLGKKFYIATADCTGHGVPGAFMSLLNISILNEVLMEKHILRPDLILNEARTDIIKALNPKGSEESKDGMDCILACFDFENSRLTYAAANNAFYIVRNGELIICKADKMPVGKSPRDTEPFNLQEVNLESGDVIYMLTDGLPDQFGGIKGKKFKYKQLEELLLAQAQKPMLEQRKILEKSFYDWKGNLEQVDDVLLIGIRIA